MSCEMLPAKLAMFCEVLPAKYLKSSFILSISARNIKLKLEVFVSVFVLLQHDKHEF